MKIAIVGAGVSGLTCAHYLNRLHEITLFESRSRLGGHTHTVDVREGQRTLAVDTGFIVYNDRTYPNFIRLMAELGVESQPTSMSLSVRCESTGLEYNGADLNGVFAQRRNLFSPRFLWMLREIVRFNQDARRLARGPADATISVGEFLRAGAYSRAFIDRYFLPMGSAIWSCPRERFQSFPMRFIAEFYDHHGLLSLRDRPKWRVVRGGSRSYLDALTSRFDSRVDVRLDSGVVGARRCATGVELRSRQGAEVFDHVVMACHSDQALRVLGPDADPLEKTLLESFPYEANEVVLHTDENLLPRNRRAWASWNYLASDTPANKATVTYNMNLLQGLRSNTTYCVTLNATERIDPAKIIRTMEYHHPVFDHRRAEAQSRHAELVDRHGVSYCGAYWGAGFHEDGVRSALAVCRRLGWNDAAPQATRGAEAEAAA